MKLRKIILGVSFAFLITTLSVMKVNAAQSQALLIGRDYGDGVNTTIDVTNAKKELGLNYIFADNVNPTISWMKGKGLGGTRMESDILFFSGHGNSSLMHFYDANHTSGYDFYIRDGYNTATDVGLSSYNLNNVKLIVFAGCQTAKGTNNITKSAQTKGASKTLGWAESIGADSHTEWLKRFWSKSNELYLNNALIYADSYVYADARVKNHNQYGNWSLPISKSKGILYDATEVSKLETDDRNHQVNIKISSLEDDNEIIRNVENWIINNIDSNFNIKNYEIEKTKQNEKDIYDFKLLLNGDIKTRLGYTVFVYGDSITNIFDNMNNENNKNLSTKISQLNNNKTLDFNNDLLFKANKQINLDKYEIINQDIYNYFDDIDGKIYQVINTELKSKVDGTFHINTYKEEI